MKTVLIGAGIAAVTLTALAVPGMSQSTIQDLRSANTVTLSGQVVRLTDDDDFLLNDGTGQIEVEAETAAIQESNLAVGTTVTVTGYYDEDEFEALTLTPAGGETTTIVDD
ncbi:NirD/YgiW/YdeI family stress tolerance protein [Nodosilinea sp. LEGE 06152]|uniref:NirD/YgiW/YdeI family stress tolerance protein n=1 Tax=Nodosilinea sp. LEGE 06152 TaxID=2777966 RepID=UPI001881D28C|nr:NirD/YgiW/YdeI family stress tolerance protein [Nodosilinea sp. LEGE 06152]MBE9160594.1 NirD/YgiW/YdeI family stress tolerance protein [Nodosilinea sp. LEGE 06152]